MSVFKNNRMKLCDPFEYKGYWWKPDDSDNKVAGVLTYKPGESIRSKSLRIAIANL